MDTYFPSCTRPNVDNLVSYVEPTETSLEHLVEDLCLPKYRIDDLFSMRFRLRMPVFVERQYFKSVIGVVRNQESRRYIDSEPEFYLPEEWRLQDADVKQGSSTLSLETEGSMLASLSTASSYAHSAETYEFLLKRGVCREQARGVLPTGMYTEFIETGTVAYYKRLIRLRSQLDAQWEIRQYAHELQSICCHPDNPLRRLFEDDHNEEDHVEGAAAAEALSLAFAFSTAR